MKENISQIQPEEIPTKLTKPWLKIVLFSVLGLVLAGGLVFTGYELGRRKVEKEFEQPRITEEEASLLISTPTPTLVLGPTADWKTYKNEKYGFEIDYPDSIGARKIEPFEEYNGVLFGIPNSGAIILIIRFYDNKQNIFLEEWWNENLETIYGAPINGEIKGTKEDFSLSGTQVNGLPALLVKPNEKISKSLRYWGDNYFLTLDKKKIFSIRILDETGKVMLSTFRFLEDCYSIYKDKEGFGETYQPGERECFIKDKDACSCWDGTKNICIPQRHCL